MLNCLLCNSTNNRLIQKEDSEKIIKKYQENFKADFSYLFKEPEIKLLECNSCGLRFYVPQISGDDHFYSVLQKNEWYYRVDKEEYNYASQFIKKGASVLDVGCGKGEFKNFIPDSHFTGLEFSSDAIKAGMQSGVNILNESIEKHSELHSGQYDVVTAFQVLEHVTNVATFLSSCAKCVKPGGKLIIAVPSEESYLKFGTNFILNMPPHHISRWTDRTLNYITKIINFNVFQIHHDEMDSLHVNSYFASLIERSLPFNSNSIKLINVGFIYKLRMKIASMLAKRVSKACSDSAWLGKGQNVTVIYERPIQENLV